MQCCKHWWLYTPPPSPHTPQTSPLCLLLCSFPAQIIQISALRFKPIVRRDYKRGPGKIKSLCLTYRQKNKSDSYVKIKWRNGVLRCDLDMKLKSCICAQSRSTSDRTLLWWPVSNNRRHLIGFCGGVKRSRPGTKYFMGNEETILVQR